MSVRAVSTACTMIAVRDSLSQMSRADTKNGGNITCEAWLRHEAAKNTQPSKSITSFTLLDCIKQTNITAAVMADKA